MSVTVIDCEEESILQISYQATILANIRHQMSAIFTSHVVNH